MIKSFSKRFVFIIIFSFLISGTSTLKVYAASWSQVPTGYNVALQDIYFPVNDTGYAVGYGGIILKSVDGGNSWDSLVSGVQHWLQACFFRNTELGWAVGTNGCVIRTDNGGNTWVPQTINTTHCVYGIYFLNDTVGWVSDFRGEIFKTTNGGGTWNSQYVQPNFNILNSIWFVNEDTGFVAGSQGTMLRTTDGGLTWGNRNTPYSGATYTGVQFTGNGIGYVSGWGDAVIKTTNNGQTWSPSLVYNGSNHFTSVSFLNDMNGYISGYYGRIFKTIDGGALWTLEQTNISSTLYSVSFNDSDHGWACGDNGMILRYSNSVTGTFDKAKVSVSLKVFFSSADRSIQINANELPQNNYSVQVMDVTGRLILQKDVRHSGASFYFTLYAGELSQGTYLLGLRSKSTSLSKSFVVD